MCGGGRCDLSSRFFDHLSSLLEFLGLTGLDKRRLRSDLVETFKILNGFYNINKGLFFDLDDGGRRGHEQKLF